jgi:RNA polymerase sigma factor (sigma-70 family)
MRVIIVDHHVVFREGLKSVLAAFDDLKVVGEASTAKEGFRLAGDQLPDLIVMDLVLPGLDGCELARELRRRRPDVQLLVLTACDAAQDLLDALDAGVQGYALKSEPVEAIVNAMRMVGSGRRYVAQKLSHISERVRRSGLARTVLALLSAREREVFRLSTAGLPAAEIAKELSISRKTVETHRYRIQKKFGLHSTTELVRFAALHDLIPPAPPSPEIDSAASAVGLCTHP